MMELNIVCVYKSGNIFNLDYVNNMYYCLSKYFKSPFHFFCFTDTVKTSTPVEKNFTMIPFQHNLRKWWAKLEAFRVVGSVLYLDLDTVIVRNMDWTAKKMLEKYKETQTDEKNKFYMLKIPASSGSDWSSSIMAWMGDFTWLLTQFTPDHAEHYDWEQKYISSEIIKRGFSIHASQSLLRGDAYLYKTLPYRSKVPTDAHIVYFHGKPKPHEVGGIYFPIAKKEEPKC